MDVYGRLTNTCRHALVNTNYKTTTKKNNNEYLYCRSVVKKIALECHKYLFCENEIKC